MVNFARHDAVILDIFGRAGSYTPPGEDALVCRAVVDRNVQLYPGDDFSSVVSEKRTVLSLRVPEVGTPVRGAVVALAETEEEPAESFTVERLLTDDGLVATVVVK